VCLPVAPLAERRRRLLTLSTSKVSCSLLNSMSILLSAFEGSYPISERRGIRIMEPSGSGHPSMSLEVSSTRSKAIYGQWSQQTRCLKSPLACHNTTKISSVAAQSKHGAIRLWSSKKRSGGHLDKVECGLRSMNPVASKSGKFFDLS
jgi:hypothetical protein